MATGDFWIESSYVKCYSYVDNLWRKAVFGFMLLDKGAVAINLKSFHYYDRMYPSQDTAGSIGNLIALPLQGQALKNHADHVFILYGGNIDKENTETRRKLKEVPMSQSLILVATGQKIGEGFDYL